jgi:hypothetical protein
MHPGPHSERIKVMTAFVRTSLSLAATLSLAIVSTTVAAKAYAATSNMNVTMKRGSFEHPRARPNSLTTGSQGQSAGPNNTFCGKGDGSTTKTRTGTVFPAPSATAAPTEDRVHDISNLRPVRAGRGHFGSAPGT